MIVWITGQHGAGKTTLAVNLQDIVVGLGYRTVYLDGDVWRSMTRNTDYTKTGRRKNLQQAMQVAILLESDNVVICAFMSPFRDMRERLKALTDTLEVHVHSERLRKDKTRLYRGYEPPKRNFLDVDMDQDLDVCVDKVVERLVSSGYLNANCRETVAE